MSRPRLYLFTILFFASTLIMIQCKINNPKNKTKIKNNTFYFTEDGKYKELFINSKGVVYLLWEGNNIFIGNLTKNKDAIKRDKDTIFKIESNEEWFKGDGSPINVKRIDSLLIINTGEDKEDIRINNFKYRMYIHEQRDSILNYYKSKDLSREDFDLPKNKKVPD